MAEELGQKERLHQGSAVDRDHGSGRTLAGAVERFGDELLARPALSANQDRAARPGDLLDGDDEAAHRRVVSDELPDRGGGTQGRHALRHRTAGGHLRLDRGLHGELDLHPAEGQNVGTLQESATHVLGEPIGHLFPQKDRLIEVGPREVTVARGAVDLREQHVGFAQALLFAARPRERQRVHRELLGALAAGPCDECTQEGHLGPCLVRLRKLAGTSERVPRT